MKLAGNLSGVKFNIAMRFLCYFIHRYLEYRIPEVESLCQLFGYNGDLKWENAPGTQTMDSPFFFIDLPSERIAREILSRSNFFNGTCLLILMNLFQ